MNHPLLIKLIINKNEYCIENPLLIIKTFCVLDPSYKKYDSKKLGDDIWLEKAIEFSNQGMRARISGEEKRKIIEKQLELDEKIKELKIFEDKNLLDKNNEEIEKLRELFKIFENIKGVKNAKMTKILHKKFPNLIPVVDSIIAKKVYCRKNKSIDDLIEIIKEIKKDYKKNIIFLEKLKFNLKKENVNLSLLRIFDIMLWMKGQCPKQKIIGGVCDG